MMDYVSSYPICGMNRGKTASASCDNENDQVETSKRFALSKDSTALAIRSMPSRYRPAEMEGALRIMNHAGRILWRAAMEAVPQSGRSYNPPLRVLTNLFQRSFGKNSENKTSSPTKSPFFSSFGSRKKARESSEDIFTTENSNEAQTDYNNLETIPESTMDCEDNIYEAIDEIQSQRKKRKTGSTFFPFLPTVVSDSEEEEDENFRPSKRTRHNLHQEPVGWAW